MKTRNLFLAVLAFATTFAATAHAGYRMTAFGNTPGFQELMAEDYDGASHLLSVRSYVNDRYARLSNLCISQLKSHAPEDALDTCDRALVVAPGDLSSLVSPLLHQRAKILTHLYSNRGVVRAVTGDVFGARADFERALTLDADNDNARLNLEHISAADVARQN